MLYPLSYGGMNGLVIPQRMAETNSRFGPRSVMVPAVLLVGTLVIADEPRFVAESTNFAVTVSGRLTKLTPEFAADLTSDTGTITVRDVISLRRDGVPLPPFPLGPMLLTTTGDRIPGKLLGGDGTNLRFRPAFTPAGVWPVPVSAVAAVWLTRTPAATPIDPARYSWVPANLRRDVLLFGNGDVAVGTLDGFAPNATSPALRFKPEAGEARTIPLADPAAVVFNPTLARTRKPKGPYAHLVLADGTRLDVTNPAVEANALKARTLFGAAVEIPLAEVVSLNVMQGKAAYLSDLKPKKAEQDGFVGPGWPFVVDRSVRGAPLRLAVGGVEQTFDRGLGTHPRTVLTYDLGGKYRRFEAVVGIDPTAGRGRADVRVLVDGKEQPLPALRELAGEAVPVRVAVTGAKELTLVVDFGPTGGVFADVNWADARLIE